MKILRTLPAAIYCLIFAMLGSSDFNAYKHAVVAQEPLFELPVQLIGFPVIILSVRLANFAKKLAYSLNPKTYQSRSRRETLSGTTVEPEQLSWLAIDVAQAERKIYQEFGPKACIEEEPCRIHAVSSARMDQYKPDWDDILKNYKSQSNGMKQWYLLSVFLGDYLRDVQFCKQLAKRLDCNRYQRPFVRD
ncbi:uncharacterized protein LOC125953721 [Anopheles darlingi]|uniref:Putative myosin light chain kinase n=1 Tax=Anopheles darlingi TaxID=43151 RepID=A0A2M4CZQ9_ANODA|nr:uncharacterized protein LOC125953721 [Anopheles darlingi]XP_049539425.1 uncharacterized protein LOC125953721 [Anopheles darlingi]XP_049539426.1 uncharacterized protein LOC125953721 [Anopheles darlingi]